MCVLGRWERTAGRINSEKKTFSPSLNRVATVREKYLENEIFSRSGKSLGILWMVREI